MCVDFLLLLIGAALAAALRSNGEASAAVAELGLRAICNFCLDNDANRARLREAGACEGCDCGCCQAQIMLFTVSL